MAETRVRSEESKKRKRETDRARSRSRLNIGDAFTAWRKLRDSKHFSSDHELAVFLLDFYKTTQSTSSSASVKQEDFPSHVSTNQLAPSSDRVPCMDVKVELEEALPISVNKSLEERQRRVGTASLLQILLNPVMNRAAGRKPGLLKKKKKRSKRTLMIRITHHCLAGRTHCADDNLLFMSPNSVLWYLHKASVKQPLCPHTFIPLCSLGSRTSILELGLRFPSFEHSPSVLSFCSFFNLKKYKENSASLTQDDATGRKKASSHDDDDGEEEVDGEAESLQPLRHHKKNPKCHICGKVLHNNHCLRRHLLVHTGERPFKCYICARGFNQKGNLKTHMKVHKGERNCILLGEKRNPKPTPIIANVCGECGMHFDEPQQLEIHRKAHRKPFSCDACGKSFKCPKSLELHSTIHTGDLPVSCPICPKRFLTDAWLKVHMLRHEGKKKFHCKLCKKSFWQSNNLRTHLKTHTGQRLHLCAVCGKSYARADTLKAHLRVHTGETPYLCSTCGKSFYYSQGYQQHLLVHNKKPKVQVKPLGRPKRNPSSDG
ncbi:uncharacterized protein ACB058_014202 isoform 2-T2 [Synchiropus picturatus]